MKITTVGIDLAKNVLQAHGVDERGKTVLRKQLKRDQVASGPASRAGGGTICVNFLAADSSLLSVQPSVLMGLTFSVRSLPFSLSN